MGKEIKPNTLSPRLRTRTIQSNQTKTKKMPGNSATNIKVVVRVRPPNKKENCENFKPTVDIINDQMLIFDPKEQSDGFFYHNVQQKNRDLLKKPNKNMQFSFDRIFGYESTNGEIFEETTKNVIQSLMDGFNCSIFAYGATGAGKTHTMLGHNNNPGITYLTMNELFKIKQELSDERKFDLCMTYIEVYNETVQDLLNPGKLLELREDSKYGVTVSGIKTYKIEHPARLFNLLKEGNSNRTQHPTDSNAESSRSHAVFQVYIRMEMKTSREVRAVKLSMIDLAGSERGSATGFTGARFTEGANINKSLLALGNCINSLADGHRHVPYRNSKLTRLLKDSLGGNCHTIMIANISPSILNYEDTYNTLKYASRAKKITTNMKKNIVNVKLHVDEYIKIIENLKNELEQTKNELNRIITTTTPSLPPTTITSQFSNAVVDENLINQLKQLVASKKELLQRIFHIECSESMVVLRRQFKEEIDSNLRDLCTNTPERDDLQRRLTKIVDRFHKQEETFSNELDDLKQKLYDIDQTIESFIKNHPEIETIGKSEAAEVAQIQIQYQVELERKKNSFLEDELRYKNNLLEKTWLTLQPCYLQLHGRGFANDKTVNNYRALVRLLQGFKNITWDEHNKKATTEEDKENLPTVNDENVASSVNILDGTFVLDSVPTRRLANDNLTVKVHQSPLKKRAPIGPFKRPNIRTKFMGTPPKKQIGTMPKNAKKPKIAEASGRPPFK